MPVAWSIENERRAAPSWRGEQAEGLDLVDVLGVQDHLQREGDLVGGRERDGRHDVAEAAFAADLVVRVLVGAVEAEVHGREPLAPRGVVAQERR